jgi:hypothetical protein
MKPVEIVRLAGRIDKRTMLLDLVRRADAPLVEQILAPLWKNLESDYVRQFLVDTTGVRFICSHRACPVDKMLDVTKGTTIAQAKEAFKLGFFTVGGTSLVPFIDGQRVDDTYCLQGGETVEFKLP